MTLFKPDPGYNYLPYDGTVLYFGSIMPAEQADYYAAHLFSNMIWQHDKAVIFGKEITTRRKVAWYGDQAFSYRYSGTTKYALPWTDDLLALKKLVEKTCEETFNACLLNLYHNGSEAMAWHSDAEIDLKKDGAIGSLSFGAERRFCFKHKRLGTKTEITLEHGSLLVMKDQTQTHWLHSLPASKKIPDYRINLTFRTICPSRNSHP